MSRILCVDVDNTLGDYTAALRALMCAERPDLPCPDPVFYDFSLTPGWPFSGSTRAFLDAHRRAVDSGLYPGEPVMDGARDALGELHAAGWRIVVSTARRDDPGDQTRRWLDTNAIPYDALHFGDKTDIAAQALIDDHPDALLAVHGRGVPVFHPDHPYCAHSPGVPFRRWADVPRLFADTLGDGAGAWG